MPSPPLHKFFDYIHCFIHFPRVRTHLLGVALLGDKTALFSVRPGNLWVTGTLKGVTEEFFGTHLVAES